MTAAVGRPQIVIATPEGKQLLAEALYLYGTMLLTLDRKDKIYTQVMKRYRNADMRMLREWDEIGNWLAVKEDLPHHAAKPDTYFQEMTLKMGWLMWSDCWKILAHYSRQKK